MEFNTASGQRKNENTYLLETYHALKYLYPQAQNSIDTYDLKTSYAGTGLYKESTSGLSGIDELMNQKMEVITTRAQMVLSEIYQRKIIKDGNIYKICLDQCACRNLIYELGEKYMEKKRVELEKKILDLEQEKRREETLYFSDLLFLRKELRESMIEGLEEKQKAQIFNDQTEALPCKTLTEKLSIGSSPTPWPMPA